MKSSFIRFVWVWLTFLLSLWLSWHLLAQTNFFYGVWHDHGGIGENIDQYGPKNKFKTGFADTSRDQRLELFAQIVDAIQNRGQGLEQIEYAYQGQSIQLLRAPEIVHLQDVANLITTLNYSAIGMMLIWIVIRFCQSQSLRTLTPRKISLSLGGGLLFFAIILMLFGPTATFYQLHIWIFPAQHQWFFFYEESLMSTMMKAPDLFGYIAVLLLGLSLILFTVITYLAQKRFGAKQVS